MRMISTVVLMICVFGVACSAVEQPPPRPEKPAANFGTAANAAAASVAEKPGAITSILTTTTPELAARQEMDDRVARVLGQASAYRQMVTALKHAVARKDDARVAALMHYPLQVRVGHLQVEVQDAAQFQARYTQLMAPEIAQAILTQDYDKALVNQHGIMLGDGQVWISGICTVDDCTDLPAPKVITLQASSSETNAKQGD